MDVIECIADVDEVAALYARDAVRVRRLVALDVRAGRELIEDACQVAWVRLLTHRSRVRRDAATRWVIRVAIHEACRQLARGGREGPLEAADAPDRAARTPSALDDLLASWARLDCVRELPVRQRRLLWMQGLGFSYEEMAGATGDSPRTVQRQLLRARGALARATAA